MPPEQAAQLTHLHVDHHVRLGFEGYSVFLAPEYLAAFARHPRLAPRIESGQVGLRSTNCMGKGRARLWDMPMVKESWIRRMPTSQPNATMMYHQALRCAEHSRLDLGLTTRTSASI